LRNHRNGPVHGKANASCFIMMMMIIRMMMMIIIIMIMIMLVMMTIISTVMTACVPLRRLDSLDKVKDIVPSLDVEFLEGQEFRGTPIVPGRH
jgi:hypothetical protein